MLHWSAKENPDRNKMVWDASFRLPVPRHPDYITGWATVKRSEGRGCWTLRMTMLYGAGRENEISQAHVVHGFKTDADARNYGNEISKTLYEIIIRRLG